MHSLNSSVILKSLLGGKGEKAAGDLRRAKSGFRSPRPKRLTSEQVPPSGSVGL